MSQSHYDLVVIGGGAAGLVTAGGAAQLGVRTLLVERQRLGGECLYTGCVPSKAIIAAAARAHIGANSRAAADGISGWSIARASVQTAISTIEPHDSPERFRGFGVEVVFGHARFSGRHVLKIGDREITARRFVVATGSEPAIPPVPGLSGLPYFTNENIFDLIEAPDHLIVIGGGVIGCELSQAFVRLGVRVTLIDIASILPNDDPEAVAVVRAQLVEDGVILHENASIAGATGRLGTVSLQLVDGTAIVGSHLLVAAGRIARTTGFGLDLAGVETTKRGITVDKFLRTSNRRIFAIGDCRDGPRLTHAADQDARTVIQNALFPFRKRADYTALPAAIFTDPELAQVGLTEARAREVHPKVEVFRHDFDHNDRSVTEGDMRGFVKIMAVGDRVIGVTIVGAHAGELLALAGFAVGGKLGLSDLANQTYAYPTLSEAIRFAAEQRGQAKLFTPTVRWITRLFQKLP
jgi:pyruvate/2-oxoglutarate dehydrogenase complex dihydrolipoamide dehydrogenase (E3) component